jgi:1,4-alpha-glucan branching enzyme
MKAGYVSLVLNAHLPFIRHLEHDRFPEERWLFEAITETYLPLLRTFERLDSDDVPFRITVSLSPTLCAMLEDEVLQARYKAHLERLVELSDREVARTANMGEFHPLALMYQELFRQDLSDFVEVYDLNLVRAFDYFGKRGRLELVTTAATHAFLPNYIQFPQDISSQIETAMAAYRRSFGLNPQGFWLPELGYSPGLEDYLKAYGLKYFFLSSHGALLGKPSPKYGSFAPFSCPNGVRAFIRDYRSSEAVSGKGTGYSSDPVYRDFYRDIGFDLALEDLTPIIEGPRTSTGFKYYSAGGESGEKKPYDPAAADLRVKEHALSFVQEVAAAAQEASGSMDEPPVIVAAFEAELFGHWWFEGPKWIEAVFRGIKERGSIESISPSTYLDDYEVAQVVEPEFSSWGVNGFGETWLDSSNDWVYRHAHAACERMIELADRFPDALGLRERALNQAARETLLSQASDWPYIMKTGNSPQFGEHQVKESISNFTRIYDSLSRNALSTEWLTKLEKKNNLFPFMNYRVFCTKR